MAVFAAKPHIHSVKNSRLIYVVDDDAAVRDSMRLFLEAHGFAVEDFSSSTEFLAKTDGPSADCLLFDLHMPGLTGIELLELLRKRGILTPAIIVTGRYDSTLERRIASAGAICVLHKPVDGDVLLATVHNALQ